ncbi:hypothetical protein [uncultured Jannaschia sp.]|uniref:AtuA-related protein n=1 Tax=uncultured Jannaschia sp. TaxID=293347 RepID=UPI00262093B3|nr:hypothetical protein [uncultured Jannaschia sp.]
MSREVELHQIAHARAGDKGDRLNVAVIAYCAADWEIICAEVTKERVGALLAERRPTAIQRYELPNLHGLNFVIDGVLDGGVNQSLNLDGHGKSLSFRILEMRIPVPADWTYTKEEKTG